MYGLYQIMYFTLIDIINTLLSPFFIVIFLIIYYQYYQISKENRNLCTKRNSILLKTLNSTFYGIIGGFIATIGFIYLEVKVIPLDFMYILIVAIILSIIDPRFMCFAYGGSIVSLVSLIFGYPRVDSKDIMMVVGTLHVVESILILINGNKENQLTFYEYSGEYVGGFIMNRFWPIPFVIFIGNDLIKPITLMAILSYGDYTLSYPKRKSIFTAILMGIYSTILLFITSSTGHHFIPPIFAILGHELIININLWIENNRLPVFTSSRKGVRVIQVCKNGIGKDLGIRIGDTIMNINGVDIDKETDIQDIERLYNGFYRITYFSMKKGITIKDYKGKRKNLGIKVVPKVLN